MEFNDIPKDFNNNLERHGEILPLHPLSAQEIVHFDSGICYARLKEFHNIESGDVFQKVPAGRLWGESEVLRILLSRLEGNSFSDIAYAFAHPTDEKGKPLLKQSGKIVSTSDLRTYIKTYCTRALYERTQRNSAGFSSQAFELSKFPREKLEHILHTLGLKQEELFSSDNRFLSKRGGRVTLPELLHALELRLEPDMNLNKVVSTLVSEGNEALGRLGVDGAKRTLLSLFAQHFSPKTRRALQEHMAKTKRDNTE